MTPVGRLGVFGGFVREHLSSLGFADIIDLPDAQNGYCYVEASGERTFVSVHGAEYTFDPAWMKAYEGMQFDYAYVCGLEVEESTGEKLVSWLEHAVHDSMIGAVVYAPGPRGVFVRKDLTDRLLALHPMLHLSGGEALAMSRETSLDQALFALHEITGSAVIATTGSEGVRFIDRKQIRSIPGIPAKTIGDTIGAGDAHCGAMLLCLCRGMTLDNSLAIANRVSCAVVQTDGATLSDEDFSRVIP